MPYETFNIHLIEPSEPLTVCSSRSEEQTVSGSDGSIRWRTPSGCALRAVFATWT